MKKVFSIYVCIVMFTVPPFIMGEEYPPTNNNGKKWVVGYFESGESYEHLHTLLGTLFNLHRRGWVKGGDYADFSVDKISAMFRKSYNTKFTWNWLTEIGRSKYITFSPASYWSGEWDSKKITTQTEEVIQHLLSGKLDLLIVYGNSASKALITHKKFPSTTVPIIVGCVPDPIHNGISKTPEKSGIPNVLVRCDLNFYPKQIDLFHRLTKFKNLGLAHADSSCCRAKDSVNYILKASKLLGFNVVFCKAELTPDCMDGIKKCWESMIPKIDALWLAIHSHKFKEKPYYKEPVLENMVIHKIPTWDVFNVKAVEHSILFGPARNDWESIGKWFSDAIIKIFNGVKPSDISQVHEEQFGLRLNLKVSEQVGFQPSLELLKTAELCR